MIKRIIFITGGVVSSLGKGLITASVSTLLKSLGYSVLTKKIDPYFNIDSGTLSPYEHGEVFITKDGGETDLDLGHYERFTSEELTKISSITAGKVYMNVLKKERKGEYEGKTVQIIPHITQEIERLILDTGGKVFDFIVIEVGGTVGDLESEVFLETIMHIRSLHNDAKTAVIHTSLLPEIYPSNEIKTKPTQHSLKHLHVKGIHPDILILRYKESIKNDSKVIKKISYLTGVKQENIFISPNIVNIYTLPLVLSNQKFLLSLGRIFNLPKKRPNLRYLESFAEKIEQRKGNYRIALVGKYAEFQDSYLSITESVYLASAYVKKKAIIDYINAESLTKTNVEKKLHKYNGIIVAPGFGIRDHNGKILACKFARESDTPFLGICFGMQMVVIEFLENVCGISTTSMEFSNSKNRKLSIILLEGRSAKGRLGGTLRLGNYNCRIKERSLAYQLYQTNTVQERHRHRYEVNIEFKKIMENKGMVFSGINEELNLIEMLELPKNRFFIACQFHPEYRSNIKMPHPLFKGLLEAI